MGTRATVKFIGKDDKPLVCIYHQFDGYLTGVGVELGEFLESMTMINGIGMNQNTLGEYANGMGCLAAQYIVEHKRRVGGLYLYEIDDTEEYNYEVRYSPDSGFNIRVITNYERDRFEGSLKLFMEFVNKEDDGEEI